MDLKTHLDDYAAYYLDHAHPGTGTSKSASSYARRIKRAYRIALKDPDIARVAGGKDIESLLDVMIAVDMQSRSLLINVIEALVTAEFEKTKKRSCLDVVSSLRLYREYVGTIKEGRNRLKPKGSLDAKLKEMSVFSHDMLMRRTSLRRLLGT